VTDRADTSGHVPPQTPSTGETAEETLERRAEALAVQLAEQVVTGIRLMLLFRLGDETCAVPLDSVREVLQEYDLTPVPCTPDYVLGVISVRGEILCVLDAELLAGVGTLEFGPDNRPPLLVLTNGELEVGLAVDGIGEIVEVPADAVELPVGTAGRAQTEFVSGSMWLDGVAISVLHVDRTLQPFG
jgi:purine-binding chemotaxis protein CheW